MPHFVWWQIDEYGWEFHFSLIKYAIPIPIRTIPIPIPIPISSPKLPHSHENPMGMGIPWEWEFPFSCTPLVRTEVVGSSWRGWGGVEYLVRGGTDVRCRSCQRIRAGDWRDHRPHTSNIRRSRLRRATSIRSETGKPSLEVAPPSLAQRVRLETENTSRARHLVTCVRSRKKEHFHPMTLTF